MPDAAPPPDTAAEPSSGSSSSTPKDPSPAPQTPLKISLPQTRPKGKPAHWRVDDSMNVKGLVRRHGDLNPLNWALLVNDKISDHPEIGKVRTQFDLAKENEQCKCCGKKKGKENMGCLIM